MKSIADGCVRMLGSLGAGMRLRFLHAGGSDARFRLSLSAQSFRWRLVLAATAACLILVLGATNAQAQQPEREFSFTGRATINGEPAPLGTTIEIEVNGKIIGEGAVSGDNGKWIIQIDAALIQEGVCEAVFYVNGHPADRQWNRCAVDIRLEVGSAVTDEAESGDAPEVQVEPDELDEAESAEEPEEPATESAADDPDASTPKVQPRSPRTGTGGLTPEERDNSWPAAAFIALGAVALASFAVAMVRRRSV